MQTMMALVKIALILTMCTAVGFGCGGDDSQSAIASAADPVVGKADSLDSADHDCQVVLREAGVLAGTPVQTVAYDGGSYYLFAAAIDLSDKAVQAGATAGLWGRATVGSPKAVQGAPAGYQRYVVEFVGPNAGSSYTSLNQWTARVIPFASYPDDARAFDHNRVPGDLDAYELRRENAFKVIDDPLVCPDLTAPARTWKKVLSCDSGGAVVDVDHGERRNLQLVIKNDHAVAELSRLAGKSYGVVHVRPTQGTIIIRGRTDSGVFDSSALHWFNANGSFTTLDIWGKDSQVAAVRIYRQGADELHLAVLNTNGDAGLPRCDSSVHLSSCKVADWVFRKCSEHPL